ncbi:MAG TPA: hypothetical protein VHE80_05775 [Acidimicrobiales bacterium]|nr:hypothetical protein [Acidimicrobiales bacterium]
MGYRGKLAEREQARELRASGWALADIAEKLSVSKSSVSLWVRDVEFEARPRRARQRGPNALQRRKAEEIEQLRLEGIERLGCLSEREFLVAGAALYAGEGSKSDGTVKFANSDPRIILFFCAWLRRFFEVDESRLRLVLYLHQGLDLQAASGFWARLTDIPEDQHRKPYRAVPDLGIRKAKHPLGCPAVVYSCSHTHRAIIGLVSALLASDALPG